LPKTGKGGVVDLMTKLIPKFSINDEITMAISKQFIVELNKYCEQGKTGNGFEYCHMREECEKCRSTDLMLVKEKVLNNPELSWLKISCDLLE